MIKPEFTLLQIQRKLVRRNAVELREPPLREAPKALDAVHMRLPSHEFVLTVEDAVVVVAVENETVVRSPAIRVDSAAFEDFALDDRQKLLPATILHHGHVDLAVAFENTEHRRFARRAAASFAADAACPEI